MEQDDASERSLCGKKGEVLSIMFRALDLNGRPVDMDEVTRRPRADLGILSPRMSADEHGRPQKATV